MGDDNGYTGEASVTFNGISSAKYLEKGGMVHATVYRIPDQGTLYSPPVVFSQDVPVTDDSITVPFTFQSAHDAFGIYLSRIDPQTITVQAPPALTAPGSYEVPVTFTNGSDVADTNVKMSLAVSAANAADASGLTVTCDAGKTSTCPAIAELPAGKTLTATYTVTVPASAPRVSYRFTGSAAAQLPDGTKIAPQNSADVISPCGLGDTCEAESGTLAGGAVVATDHTGYTGSGFVAGFTSPGGSVTQEFSVPTAGTYTVNLRYAAGSGGPNQVRSATVSTNGAVQGQIQLPLTANWDTWGNATIPVQL
ncbi:MAG: CBM35 domain-containing protein, partial [Trebonia sp.]